MNGLFLIDRSMLDHHIVGMQNKDRFCMWIWLLSAARWKPQRIFVQGKEIELQRGQLFVSLRNFAKENSVSKGVAERFLRDLKSGTMIETVNETGGTLITICNYDVYQDLSNYRGTVSGTANETATGQRRDIKEHQITPENTREEILAPVFDFDQPVENLPVQVADAPPKKGKRLDEDWRLPKEWGEWAMSEGWEVPTIRCEADKFRDYWVSVPGAKGRKLNWLATWRNWMRNSKTARKGSQNETPTKSQSRLNAFIDGATEGL